MRWRNSSFVIMLVIAFSWLLDSSTLHAQKDRRGSRNQQPSDNNGRERNNRDRRSPGEEVMAPLSYHKSGTKLERTRLDFLVSGYQWPQPDGKGTAVTITYSYSNLLDDQLRGLTDAQIKQAVEESLALWASAAPLHFVEVADSGPAPTQADPNYSANNRPQIRIGAHLIDGATGNTLAHTYLPFSDTNGLAGDVHFDNGETWGGSQGGFFLEVCLHELGHSLGLDHESVNDAIMNPVLANRFDGLGDGFLLPDDIEGIRAIYGEGIGSVTPLDDGGGDTGGGDTGGGDTGSEPAGVTATIDYDTDTITLGGDKNANNVAVFKLGCFTFVIGLEDTPVNGESIAIFCQFGDVNLNCDLGAGNDQLYLFRISSGEATCHLGEGDDALVVLFSSIDLFTADGGDGSDWLIRIRSSFGESLESTFESVF